jgi:putative lipoprotein
MGRTNRRTAITLMLAGLTVLQGGHVMAQGRQDGRIVGHVVYRERMLLPPDALVTVSLLDVSLADAPAEVLGQVQISGKTASPIAYQLDYDPARLKPGHRYSLQARITQGDTLMFISTTANPPDFTTDAAHEIMVTRVDAAPGDLGGDWLAEDIEGAGVIDNLQTTLSIAADGTVSGSTGCNRFTGRAEVEGPALRIGALAVTSRMCLDAPMDQERKFLAALEKVRAFRIRLAENQLFLLDESETPVMRLSRHQG